MNFGGNHPSYFDSSVHDEKLTALDTIRETPFDFHSVCYVQLVMGVKIKLTTAILQYKNTKKLNIATHLCPLSYFF